MYVNILYIGLFGFFLHISPKPIIFSIHSSNFKCVLGTLMESQVSSPGFHGEETHATHAEEKNGLPFGSWRVQDSPHPRHITAVCEGQFLEHKLNTRVTNHTISKQLQSKI